jgi:hypothetical protein
MDEDTMEVEETYEQRAMINSKKHRRVAYRLTKKKGQQEQSALMQLPNEVLEQILHKLTRPDDALRFMASCRLAYNRLRRDARFWGRFYPKLYFVKEPAYGAHHIYMTSCKPWAQNHGYGVHHMHYGMNDLCTDPKHYIRSVRKPKTELPADPFDSVCKALSKQNLAAYRKESQRDHSSRIRTQASEKVDLERRIKLLKDQWVDAAAEEIKETTRKRKYEEMIEKSMPFIDLEKFESTSS